MSYVPKSWQLRGLSRPAAELYGKPHVGAFYAGGSAKSHRMIDGARCAACGRPATNVHHVAPLSKGGFFEFNAHGMEAVRLRPSLFALCGSGTTGCHGGFHGGARFRAEWLWYDDAAAEAWWSGELLRRFGPHSDALYAFGYWAIRDGKGEDLLLRGAL